MRIAIVTETFLPNVNGITRMLLEYLHYLRAHGHDAVVFAPGEGERRYCGYDIVRIAGAPFPPYPELILAPYSLKMGRLMRAWQPDLVHLASPFVLGMHGLHVAKSLGVPVAAHYQTDIARYAQHYGLGALTRLAWRRLIDLHNACTVTFAPTPAVAQELTERGIQRVHVSGRGVDGTLFHPARRDAALRSRLTGGQDGPIMLYVGRVSPEKNLSLLAAVARAIPDHPLVIVGDGPARLTLSDELAGLNVHFTGMLRGEELAAVYASADLFIFPSETETFGQVVREAMASGLPTVGMRAGGVQDLIVDEVTGVLCAAGDEAAFVGAAQCLLADAGRRRSMGEAARLEADQHTWEAILDHLTGFYAGLAVPSTASTLVAN